MDRPHKVWIKWLSAKGKTPEGRRYLVLRVQGQPGGSISDEGHGWATVDEAEQIRARRLLGLLRRGSSSRVATVADVLGEYMAELRRRKDPASSYVVHEDRYCVALGRHLGRTEADRLTTSHLRRYVGDRRKEPTRDAAPPARTTLWQELRALKAALKLGRDLGLVLGPELELPSRKEIPDDARPPRSLTQAEVAAVLAKAYSHGGDKIGSLFTVHAWSGRRPVAVHQLHLEDAAQLEDEHRVYWRADKGGIARGWGPLAQPARVALLEHVRGREPGPLWLTEHGNPYTPATLDNHWTERLARLADVAPFQLYDLRRFACTQIVAMTPTLAHAQLYTGHLRKETLLRYVSTTATEATSYAPRIGWTAEPLRLVGDDPSDD